MLDFVNLINCNNPFCITRVAIKFSVFLIMSWKNNSKYNWLAISKRQNLFLPNFSEHADSSFKPYALCEAVITLTLLRTLRRVAWECEHLCYTKWEVK